MEIVMISFQQSLLAASSVNDLLGDGEQLAPELTVDEDLDSYFK